MTESRPPSRLILTASLVLVAFNMRPALTSLGPVLPEAMRDTGLDPGSAGLLTTLPVLCLGLFGLTAPLVARRLGAERAVLVFMLVLAAGIGLRGFAGAIPLVLGCALGGIGIGVANVLAPAIIKAAFPAQAAAMMGVYTMALTGGAAIAAGATVPLEHLFGGRWASALAAWAIPALAAAAVWAAQLRKPAQVPNPDGPPAGLWRDPLAWQVTAFMGLQSSLAYSIFAWLAPIIRDRGFSALEAGLIVSTSILVSAPSALAAPVVAARGRDQRIGAVAFVALSSLGMAGCLFAPTGGIWLWAIVLGVGQGATFSLAMAIIVLRAGDPAAAGSLSSMSQGVGYTMAAIGPLLMGLLRSWTGGWTASAVLFFVIATGAALAGLGAGRDAQVRARPAPAPAAA